MINSKIKDITNGPVFPIPPSYKDTGELDIGSTTDYINFLETGGANTIVTTAGTSQYNLLDEYEIRRLNEISSAAFSGVKILGLPEFPNTRLAKEIDWLNENIEDDGKTYLMGVYPERYYDDSSIINYFHFIADKSNFPVLFHGRFMRRGNGGLYDFTSSLINKVAIHPNIFGMKEEGSSFNIAYNVCKDIDKDDFAVIVAGGSMRRFNLLKPTGVQTFLSGVGSIFPEIEIDYFNRSVNLEHTMEHFIIEHFENPLFDTFMEIGWHKSMRQALNQKDICCFYNRAPFPDITSEESDAIFNTLRIIENRLASFKEKNFNYSI
jgi:dihydrodipicolinate synthase/N-acetylneuraminate lyase